MTCLHGQNAACLHLESSDKPIFNQCGEHLTAYLLRKQQTLVRDGVGLELGQALHATWVPLRSHCPIGIFDSVTACFLLHKNHLKKTAGQSNVHAFTSTHMEYQNVILFHAPVLLHSRATDTFVISKQSDHRNCHGFFTLSQD